MKSFVLLIIISMMGLSLSSSSSKCRTLVLSGGGNKGAYEAGAMNLFAQVLGQSEAEYDVVSGVSAGAINAFFTQFFAKGDELEMTNQQVMLWQSINTSTIYVPWDSLLYGILDGIFYEKGIFNNDPLVELLTQVYNSFSGNIKRDIIVGTVDSVSGTFYTYENNLSPKSDIINATIASASIPAVFPFRDYKGHQFIDGGTAWGTNLASAVKKCYDKVGSQDKIEMDVITLTNLSLDKQTSTGNTISNYMRYFDIKNYYNELNNIIEVMREYPYVNYRYLLIPTEPLASGIHQIQFDNATMFPMIQQGMKDAQAAIDAGPGANFRKIQQWYDY